MVIANLSPISFELLRYVPRDVFRVGVAHADNAGVYETVRIYASHLDLLATVSQTIRVQVEAMPEFRQVSVRYLPLGVPMPAAGWQPHRDPQSPLRILYFGRVEREQKRPHLFPEIYKQLQASGIPFAWTIAGDGAERPALEQVMRSSSPHQTIRFSGNVPYASVPHLLKENDVFLLASDYEGLPLSLLEAMGHGLVPVVSDLPSGVREVVDDSNGKRVAPENTQGYADAILWLHHHRAEMETMALKAREKVSSHFSIAAMTDRWLSSFPRPPAPSIVWPDQWPIRPPLVVKNRVQFWPVLRVVRRLIKRFA